MGIKNLTEAEEKEFYRLVEKMNGKEPDKERDVKVKKPQKGDTYFLIEVSGNITKTMWTNNLLDRKRYELGNIFFTEESAEFAREKRKVEVGLQRYAEEHNNSAFGNHCYCIRYEGDGRLLCDTWATAKIQGVVMFTSRDVLVDAIGG